MLKDNLPERITHTDKHTHTHGLQMSAHDSKIRQKDVVRGTFGKTSPRLRQLVGVLALVATAARHMCYLDASFLT